MEFQFFPSLNAWGVFKVNGRFNQLSGVNGIIVFGKCRPSVRLEEVGVKFKFCCPSQRIDVLVTTSNIVWGLERLPKSNSNNKVDENKPTITMNEMRANMAKKLMESK